MGVIIRADTAYGHLCSPLLSCRVPVPQIVSILCTALNFAYYCLFLSLFVRPLHCLSFDLHFQIISLALGIFKLFLVWASLKNNIKSLL